MKNYNSKQNYEKGEEIPWQFISSSPPAQSFSPSHNQELHIQVGAYSPLKHKIIK